jgi:hypothetical protein
MGFVPMSFARVFVGVTFGVLGVGLGAFGFINAADAYASAERIDSEIKVTIGREACSTQGAYPFCRTLDQARERTNDSLAMGIGGLAFTAVSGALLMYEFGRRPLPPQEAGLGLRPAVMAVPGGGAVTISGSF